MKCFVAMTLLLFALVAPPFSAAQKDSAEAQVLAAEKARTTALVNADAAALDKLLADDLTYVHASGKVDNKASFLAGIKSGQLHYMAWEPTEMHVRLSGNTAVLNGEYAVRANDLRVQAEPFDIKVIFLSVYARRDGKWQQIAWQTTKDTGVAANH